MVTPSAPGPAAATGSEAAGAPEAIYSLGPEGTFSDQAARRLRQALAPAEVPIRYTHTIPEVLSSAEAGAEAWGVLPIENSVAGIVGQAQDGLVTHQVTIFREVNVRVRYSLLAAAPLERVETYLAHPQAFDQCSEYLAAHLPAAEVSFTRSNMASGLAFLEAAEAGRAAAAIVPVDFGREHRRWRVAEDIQTFQNNTTRFLAVRRRREPEAFDFGRAKTSVCIQPHEDRPGLLYEILSVFDRHRINLCRLESRPAKVLPWAYVFFIDFTNNAHSAQCLADLRQTPNTITVLGSYDALE